MGELAEYMPGIVAIVISVVGYVIVQRELRARRRRDAEVVDRRG